MVYTMVNFRFEWNHGCLLRLNHTFILSNYSGGQFSFKSVARNACEIIAIVKFGYLVFDWLLLLLSHAAIIIGAGQVFNLDGGVLDVELLE